MPDDMASSVPLSVRVPGDIVERFDRLAEILDRPRSWVILRALRQYLSEEGQDLLDVKAGLAELDRGESVPMGEALDMLDKSIQGAGAKRGKGE